MILNTISPALKGKANNKTMGIKTLQEGLLLRFLLAVLFELLAIPPTNQALQELSKSTENPEKLVISGIGTTSLAAPDTCYLPHDNPKP
jgi:hypothetical protein